MSFFPLAKIYIYIYDMGLIDSPPPFFSPEIIIRVISGLPDKVDRFLLNNKENITIIHLDCYNTVNYLR